MHSLRVRLTLRILQCMSHMSKTVTNGCKFKSSKSSRPTSSERGAKLVDLLLFLDTVVWAVVLNLRGNVSGRPYNCQNT